MIPVRLTVKNFLCYGENVPVLNFTGINVACLCGPNGHGKSSLLDAITWALWGRARGRTQEELVHHGQRDMQVELEFLARNVRYRVNRRYTRGVRSRQGATLLELQIGRDSQYKSVGGNTIRETEEKIRRLLSMDYETFTNSAFLLQGRADLFTHATPLERKKVLAGILDLGLYDRLEERAKQSLQERLREESSIRGQLEQLRTDVWKRSDYEVALNAIPFERNRIEVDLSKQEILLNEIRSIYTRLSQVREDLQKIDQELSEGTEEAEKLLSQEHAQALVLRELEGVVGRAGEIENRYLEARKTRDTIGDLDKSQARSAQLHQDTTPLVTAISMARQDLAREDEQLRQELRDRLEPATLRIPVLYTEKDLIEQKLIGLKGDARDLQKTRTSLQDVIVDCETLGHTQSRIEEEGTNIRSRQHLLSSSPDNIRCPLCQSELGYQGRERLAASYDLEIEERRREYRDISEQLHPLRKEREQLEKTIQKGEQQIDDRNKKLQRQLADVESGLKEAKEATHSLTQVRQRLVELESRLRRKDYAIPEQERLSSIHQELALIGYEADLHQSLRNKMVELESAEDEYRRLQFCSQQMPEARRVLDTIGGVVERRKQVTQRNTERRQELVRLLEIHPQSQDDLASTEEVYNRLKQSLMELMAQEKTLQELLNQIAGKEQDVVEKEISLRKVNQEREIFSQLAIAFGKAGVQALLIEAVVPELEVEANLLLHRLTDSRLSVKLETQRARRIRSDAPAIETLEINVSDELGTRSYEMFSGGEAFRIDFALRIALSKLLARRSGAPLPTLFIDEGFGSQDAQGREHLLEAIKSIESDFERIIVITHIEEIKDRFPVRIEVAKTEHGSTFWIT